MWTPERLLRSGAFLLKECDDGATIPKLESKSRLGMTERAVHEESP